MNASEPKYLPLQLRLWRTFEAPEYVDAVKVATWVQLQYEFSEYREGLPHRVIGYTLRLAGAEVAAPTSPLRALWETARHPGLTVGIEAWASVQPAANTPGAPDGPRRWLYTVYPHLFGAEAGPWVDPYGESHPSLVFHSSDEGPDWGPGPHPVALDADGNPEHISQLTRDNAFLMMVTTMSPDDALAYTTEKDTTS